MSVFLPTFVYYRPPVDVVIFSHCRPGESFLSTVKGMCSILLWVISVGWS